MEKGNKRADGWMKVQEGFINRQVPIIRNLEDVLQVYLHHKFHRNLWESFSSAQKEGFKDYHSRVLIKNGKIKLLPPPKGEKRG